MISSSGHITILESVDSTNNYAMGLARDGRLSDGDAFFALRQDQGKGQRGRTWISEPGANVILSLAIRPAGLRLQQQVAFNAAIALAAHHVFAKYAGSETSVKWPNDIYWRDRKAAGILVENSIGAARFDGNSDDTNAWQWAIVGVGMNVNQTLFEQGTGQPVSLKQITGKDYEVIELAKELYTEIQRRVEDLRKGNDVLDEYNLRLYKKDTAVRLKQGARIFTGIIRNMNADGELVVETGMEEHFQNGEIEWMH